MIAQVCNLKCGDFIHTMGDMHIYTNHVELIQNTQLKRTPNPFPTLEINKSIHDIDHFTSDDFKLVGYDPHPPIKMDMAI